MVEIEKFGKIIQILNRRSKNNPCLIGEPGVGKTAIAKALAIKIANGDVPAKLLNKDANLNEINKKLQEDVKSLKDNLTAKNAQITALEQQIANKEIEISNFLNNYTTEFENLKTNSHNTLEEEKKKFNESIESDRKSFGEQFDEDQNAFQKAFEDQSKNFENKSTEVIDKLNSKLAEANKIVNIVGNVGVTGNYQKIANQHKESANFFR